MRVMSRKAGEEAVTEDGTVVTVLSVIGGKVRLAIEKRQPEQPAPDRNRKMTELELMEVARANC